MKERDVKIVGIDKHNKFVGVIVSCYLQLPLIAGTWEPVRAAMEIARLFLWEESRRLQCPPATWTIPSRRWRPSLQQTIAVQSKVIFLLIPLLLSSTKWALFLRHLLPRQPVPHLAVLLSKPRNSTSYTRLHARSQ